MRIISQPIYDQSFEKNGEFNTFLYNIVAAKTDVNLIVESEQARPLYAVSSGINSNAFITVQGDISAYLAGVTAASGSAPVVYLRDDTPGIPDYTGSYKVLSVTVIAGNTRLLLENYNGTASYQGNKTFDAASQLLYRYKSYLVIEYYNRTREGTNEANIRMLNPVTQTLNASGIQTIALSEVAKSAVPERGCVGVQVEITEYDYLGQVGDKLVTGLINFVNSSIFQKNYGDFTLFNPNSGGGLLPSSGNRIFYGGGKIQPFFLNFVLTDFGAEIYAQRFVYVLLTAYDIDGNSLGSVEVDVSNQVVTGLNSLDLSTFELPQDAIESIKPYKTGVKFIYSASNGGDYDINDYESADYETSGASYYSASSEAFIPCEEYKLNNLRDFYFSFTNGWGGLSTFCLQMYNKKEAPDILQLRNQNVLANIVVRATERYELTGKYLPLQDIRFLTGNDLQSSQKQDGIFESEQIIRYDQFGVQTNWLLEPAEYEQNNTDRYQDIKFTVVRPDFADAITSPVPTAAVIDLAATDTTVTATCVVTAPLGAGYISPVRVQRAILSYGATTATNRNFEFNPPVNGVTTYKITFTGVPADTQCTVTAQAQVGDDVVTSPAKQIKTTV